MATVDPASLIGRSFGPVEVLSALGRGGMGTVYRARDGLGREVALKLALDPQHRTMCEERFRREGEIAASLDHPGIVRVHSAGVAEDLPYMVCELVEGARMLDQAGVDAPLAERARWVAEAAHAIGHAHARGVIHRDLKPGNILVGADGAVKVVDFGVALAERFGDERLTETGTTVGTYHYMSLEQLRGKRGRVTPASDVWSLGVVLYEALTDQRPFNGANAVELAMSISNNWALPPGQLEPTVPPALEAVCLKALDRDPDQRYADGEELAADLELALAGEVPSAGQSEFLRLGGGEGRRFAMAGAAGLGSMALGLAILFGARGDSPSEQSPSNASLRVAGLPPAAGLSVAERARSAVERGELEEAVRVLSAEPSLSGQEGLAALRAQLFARGRTLLEEPEAGGRSLQLVFESLGLLNEVLGEPEPDFALAVLGRALALEEQSSGRLGDERVVRLLEGLAEGGMTLPPIAARQALDDLARATAKPRHEEFGAHAYRLLLALLRLQTDVIGPHYVLVDQSVNALPPLQKGADPCERYLRIRAELSFHSRPDMIQRPESKETRARCFGALEELLEATRPEEMGSRTYANALAHVAGRRGNVKDVTPLYRRALGLSPGNPRLLAFFAEYQLETALARSKAGEPEQALERIREARRLAEEALRQSKQLGYEEAACYGWICQLIRGRLVRSAGLLGDREAAEAVIASTPDVPWISRGRFRASLRQMLEAALRIHEGALSETPRD